MELNHLVKGKSLFLDTAPLIYFIEKNRRYHNIIKPVITQITKRDIISFRSALPDAGQPRFHGEAPPLPRLVFLDFGGDRRSGPDQAHFASQHIDDLRKLVQAGFP